MHLLIPAAAALAAAGFLLFVPGSAQAISGTVAQISVQVATDSELAEAVVPRGVLVQRASDPKDLRIGDGYTTGGISLWNFAALTNPPTSFPHDVQMNNHHVRLDAGYSLNAESGRLTAWYGTNAVWTVLATASAAEDVLLSVLPDGTNMAFTVASESDDVVVEVCASLIDPVWTAISFGFERLTPQTVKITVPNPPVGEMQYVRVLTEIGSVGMAISIPLSVPSLTVGGAAVTATAISNWNAAAASAGSGFLPLAAGPSNAITGVLWVSNSVVIGENGTSTGAWSASVGGYGNDARGYMAITLGGEGADARGSKSGVLAGSNNETTGIYSAVIGGLGNAAYGESSVVVCGRENVASGLYAVASGYKAKAVHDGAFVFSDNTSGGTTSTAPNQVTFRAAGGFRILGGRLEPAGGVRNPVNTTNIYLRPDGGTNTISFDVDGNMIIAVDGTTALTVRTNGNIGIKHAGSGTYPLYVSGDIVSTSRMRASEFRDNAASTYYLDPNGESILSSAKFDGTITVTQGVTQIILPTSTNGLVSGTLWNDAGTVKVMP